MNNIKLLDKDINIKKKKKSNTSSKKTPLSAEYKTFLKKKSNEIKSKSHKNTDEIDKSMPIKKVESTTKLVPSKKIKIVKMNKNKSDSNFVSINNIKDSNKSKNKFTKKSQEKQKKRKSKRKKIHRKITKVKRLSFKCNDNNLNIKKLLEDSNKKSNNEIKEELKKKGIDIKSNKNKLLKDLYLFTSCNNINVVKE